MGVYLLGFLTLAFLGLSIFAFLRPLTKTGDNIQYQQESQFSYSATGTPVIYDTETVRSGEPVFPRLTCFLNIGFTYSVLGGQLQDVSGSYQLVARVLDEQSGWQRTTRMHALRRSPTTPSPLVTPPACARPRTRSSLDTPR